MDADLDTSTPQMTPPELATARLTLTGHRIDDLDACAAMWADPAVYAMIGGQPRSREDVWIRLLRSIGQWTAFGYGAWVLRDAATGQFLGEIGLLEARRDIDPAIDAPEMGWTLAPHAHSKGYAAEALDAILAWTDAQGIGRTMCIIDPGNGRSIRLAERMGYRTLARGTYHGRAIDLYERMAAPPPNR